MALTKSVSADNQTYTEVLCWYVYHILYIYVYNQCEMGNLANCATVGSGSNLGGKVCFECRMMGYMPEQRKKKIYIR